MALFRRKKTPLAKAGQNEESCEADETVVRVEVVLKPIEVQIPVLAIEVEVRNVTVAIRVLPDKRTRYHLNHHPSNTLKVESYLGH